MTTIYILEKDGTPFYIGKSVNFNVRKSYHRKKYGENISWCFIDEVSNDEWKFWEKHYISLFKSWGFRLTNQNNGGGGATKYTQEQSKKITKAKLGMKYNMTPESKKSKAKKLKGIKRSEETKQKISKAKKGHECYSDPKRIDKIKANSPFKKSINQYSLQNKLLNTFISAQEAGRCLGKSGNQIADCASGRQKTAFGYIWKYIN
jgi:hypothetical protein